MSTEARHEISLKPLSGWHCSHLYYRFQRAALERLSADERREALDAFRAALDPAGPGAPLRLQSFVVSGQKADFGLLLLDPDPLLINRLHHRLMAGPLGPALEPVWSFISMTEISEYLPTVEHFGQRLVGQGIDPNSDDYRSKLDAYARRLEIMRRQRLTPDLPVWPAMCFYPMNKKRAVGENWFLLDFHERERLMSEHGESGMKFGGRVTQMITSAMGLDDWEWGVTLWARNPEFLRDIVYRMRFDEASARYAEFGPFYVGYLSTAAEILQHCGVA
jgi:chlorite dismutase